MYHAHDTEEMKTSIEEKHRNSLQWHRAVIAVLALLLLSSVALMAGVVLTDGLGLCEQKELVSVEMPGEYGRRVKRSSWGYTGRWSKTTTATTENPHVYDCNLGCQPIPDIETTATCPPGCAPQCLPGQPGCMNAGQGPGGDTSCGTAIVIVCDRGARRRGPSGQATGGAGPATLVPPFTECLTLERPGAQRGNVPPGCREVEVTVCGEGRSMGGNFNKLWY